MRWLLTPESKWFGTYSLVLLPTCCVEKPRRPGLAADAYVFRLAGDNDNGVTKFPTQRTEGMISEAKPLRLRYSIHTQVEMENR